ncbi:Hyaluronidase-2 [Sigmodon hispidus]
MRAGLGPIITLALVLEVAWAVELKPTVPPIFTGRPFVVAWNVPTQECAPRHKVPLDLSVFDVEASPNEGFVNQNITTFYYDRLGLYPRFDAAGMSVHGGVPQNGSLCAHLPMLKASVERYIHTQEPGGLAVIDWEEWRPVWVRNWQEKDVYRQWSRQLVASRHPDWPVDRIVKQAQYEFEFAARQFMLNTLRYVKAVRPQHLWGFYLFPDCYNHDYVQNWESYTGRCPDVEVARNDQLAWLWAESTALFPSVYLEEALASSTHSRNFVSFRVQEALRVAHTHHANHALPVYVFTRPTYTRGLKGLSQMDLISTIGESAALGSAGVIFWGDSVSASSMETCQYLKNYLTQRLVPYVVNVSWATQYCSWTQCHGHGRCVRRNPNANTFLHLSASSFRLVPGRAPKEPQLRPEGELSDADLNYLQTHFRCQCYLGWGGEQCQRHHKQAAGSASRAWAESQLVSLLALEGDDLGSRVILKDPIRMEVLWKNTLERQKKPGIGLMFSGRQAMNWVMQIQDTYWCLKSHGVDVDVSVFDVIANKEQSFQGSNMTIFYSWQLGTYPYYTSTGEPIFGGLPQNASLLTHLARTFQDIKAAMPEPDFSGLAVIDWEEWRPRWAFNWDSKDIYRQRSKALIQEEHPDWPETLVEEVAEDQFQKAAQAWMAGTLQLGKMLRPHGLWGYYGFPDCYNYNFLSPNYTGQCPVNTRDQNDQLDWLWNQSYALYPSIYLPAALMGTGKTQLYVRHRLQEAFRIFYEITSHLLPLEELEHSLGESVAQGVAGVVVWVSSENTKTKESCQIIKEYMDSTLGPFIVNVTSAALLCSEALCSGHGRCARRPSYPEALLTLNPSSFSIQLTHDGRPPSLKGTLSLKDQAQMAMKFQCRCYGGWHGKWCEKQGGDIPGTEDLGGAPSPGKTAVSPPYGWDQRKQTEESEPEPARYRSVRRLDADHPGTRL